MSERSKRIMQKGRKITQAYDLSESKDDPYSSSDSLNDPNYSPTSDDNSSFGAGSKNIIPQNKPAIDTNANRNISQCSNFEINRESSNNSNEMENQVSHMEENENMVEIIEDTNPDNETAQAQTCVHTKNINKPECSYTEIN